MSQFEVGDKVRMPGVPYVVEVLAVGTDEHNSETLDIRDPESGELDTVLARDFVKA